MITDFIIPVSMVTGYFASLWIVREVEGRRGVLLVAVVFGVFLILMMPGVIAAVTEDGQVGASADDGWSTSGSLNTNGATLFIGEFGTFTYDAWARFTSVSVPRNATINAAYITVEAQSSADDGVGVATNIYLNADDDATRPVSIGDHASKVRTTNFTAWDDEDFVIDTPTNSPSIVSAVQEVVSRPGWDMDNAMMVLWDDDTSADQMIYRIHSWDGDSAKAVILHIEYTWPIVDEAVSEFWTTTSGLTLIIGIIGLLILVVLALIVNPIIFIIAGIGDLFLIPAVYEGTQSVGIATMFAFIGLVLIIAGSLLARDQWEGLHG